MHFSLQEYKIKYFTRVKTIASNENLTGDDILQQLGNMQREKKTELAIAELGIKVNTQDENDKYELSDLLCQILSYPTWEEAEIHRKSNHLGNFDLLSQQGRLLQLLNSKNTNQLQLCPCCGNIINQKEIPFNTHLSQIKLGIGVRLYFTTLLHNTLIFSMTFVFYSLYTMITNINASKEQIQQICGHNQDCSTANIGTGAKLASYQDFKNELAVQSVLGFMCVLVWAAILVKNYFNDKKLEKQLKRDWLSASDFTLMLQNYPASFLNPKNYEETLSSIKQQFKQYQILIKSRIPFQVVKVSIGFPLFGWAQQHKKQMKQALEEIQAKRTLFKNMVKQRQRSPFFQLSQQKRNKQYEQFYQLFTNHQYEKSNFLPDLQQTNTIFVTLRYSRARQYIEKINKLESKCMFLKTDNNNPSLSVEGVRVKKAPEPDQIKWQNIGFSQSLKFCRKIMIYMLALLLIGLTLAISIFLGSIQADKPVLISILISVVITVINFLIEFIIILVSYFERQFRKSKEEASIGIKIAVSQIINCIGVPITLVCLDKQSIYSSGGLVTNVFFIGLINMLLPIGRFIDPFNIVLLLREKYYHSSEKRLHQLEGQTDLNKICCFYQFQLGYEYAYIIKTAYFTGFYLTLQPVIALFAPVGLILMFFCNKYRLLYRFNKPNFHSSSVNSMLNFILKCSLVAFSVGQLYFMNFQSYTAQFQLVINWVSFGLSVIFVFFPLSYCRKSQDQNSGLDYNQQMLYLTTDYDRLNPVTKEKAIADFKEYLEEYQKKCQLPLPYKSQIIRRSIIQISKHSPASIINFMKEKTKIKEIAASELYTIDRFRNS